jgi:hypothetical protein
MLTKIEVWIVKHWLVIYLLAIGILIAIILINVNTHSHALPLRETQWS